MRLSGSGLTYAGTSWASPQCCNGITKLQALIKGLVTSPNRPLVALMVDRAKKMAEV